MNRISSITYKIFFGIFFLTVFFLSLMWFAVHTMYSDVLRENEIKYNLLATNKTKSQFDLTIDMIQRTTASLYSNKLIHDKLAEPMGDYPQKHSEEQYEINQLLKNVLELQPFIESIHILGTNHQGYSSSENVDWRVLYNNYSQYFKKAAQKGGAKEFWSGGYDHTMSYIQVYQTTPNQVIGLIVININYDYVREMFMVSAIQANERVMIVNSEGQILFNFPHFTSFEPFLEQYPEILIPDKIQMDGQVFGEDCIIVSETINMADWKIIRIIQTDSITAETTKVSIMLKNIIIVCAVICLLYGIWLTQTITKPVKILNDACMHIEQGDLSVRVNIHSRDELGTLGKTFNMMMDQLGGYFERELTDQKRKSEMQFQILQAQINPHFLYNTLDSIKWLAVMQNVNNIAEMSTSLINLLKYNLVQTDAVTTLRDELESVKNYINIQKFRYSDNFDFSTKIDEGSLDCVVVRFILQPLVENCLIHGFKDMEEDYRIRIASYFSDNKLHIKVIDNGSGMDDVRRKEVNSGMDKGKRFNQIGVQNIRERIKLYFGEECELYYDSEPHVGTIAVLVLPIIRNDPPAQ